MADIIFWGPVDLWLRWWLLQVGFQKDTKGSLKKDGGLQRMWEEAGIFREK
jgi:hypothetical protein